MENSNFDQITLHLGQIRQIFMKVLQNRPNTAIYFSSVIQFKYRPLLNYLAKNG